MKTAATILFFVVMLVVVVAGNLVTDVTKRTFPAVNYDPGPDPTLATVQLSPAVQAELAAPTFWNRVGAFLSTTAGITLAALGIIFALAILFGVLLGNRGMGDGTVEAVPNPQGGGNATAIA